MGNPNPNIYKMTEIDILKAQLERAKALAYKDRDTLDDIVRKGKCIYRLKTIPNFS